MNIFALDRNPFIAAQMMGDKHVRSKMIVETAQILSNCFTLEKLAGPDCPRTQKGTPRKHSYPKHPCCLWVKQTMGNMYWLIEHGWGLTDERSRRWPGSQRHFTEDFLDWVRMNWEDNCCESRSRDSTPFAQAVDEEFKGPDAVKAYIAYYKHSKKHLHQWTNVPSDLIECFTNS